MFQISSTSLAALSFSVLAIYHASKWIYSRRSLPLPPGPTRLPVIGNHLQLPETRPWERYTEWKRQYGDIVYLKDWRRDIIILNSFQAAYDLMERKSAIYSGRPQFIMFHELMDFGKLTAFLAYGETWRKHRTMYAKQMHPPVIGQFYSLQISAIRRLLEMLFRSPDKFADHIRHMPASIVMAFTYGYEIQEEDDPYVKMAGANSRAFARAVIPGAFLVDNIPLLKYIPSWFPGAGFQKIAASSRSTIKATRDALFEMVTTELQNGRPRPSFVGNCLMDSDISIEKPEDIDILKNVAVGIFGAGTTTTSATIMYFVLAMVLYPEVMRKAHAELDEVVGRNRLPEFSDRERLPYINAIMKETFRWFPVAPTGIPHATTKEDAYQGYRIPAGSMIIPNTWEILHDEKTYPQPYSFRPERFIPDHTGYVEKDPTLLGNFGFGRRICAGKNLAEATIWLTISNILALFTIEHAVDSAGQKIDISYALQADGHSLCIPKPFPCKFIPRDSQAAHVLSDLAIQRSVTAQNTSTDSAKN